MRAERGPFPATVIRYVGGAWIGLAYCLASAPAAAQMVDTSSMSLQDVENLTADSAPAASTLTPMRAQVLRETALPLGSHKGLADRSKVIIKELDARATRLDTMYRFGALVTKKGVLPPVIVEAVDAIEGTTDQLRRADAMYRIVVPAHLVTVPPSWRDYLYIGLRLKAQADPIPFSSVLPKTAAEEAYWKEQVQLGYRQGTQLADQILSTNLARLNRDYVGMLRYSELLNRGMVSEPDIAVAQQVVTGDSQRMNIGDTLVRVTNHGGLVTDASKWRVIVAPAAASGASVPSSPEAVVAPINVPAVRTAPLATPQDLEGIPPQ
ncbi:type IV secretory system conjugative DNA transfer family protein [Paraburkholderia sp. BR10872]|uniref:type IV secretory system conjugative DNA transfer family protein n=1 Tax=Paraburkholderia sp. BR10872 TaxID=3236989 RepID=UPI0034D25A5F